MEFSFKVSESEFRQAWKLERKASSRSSLKNATFWILIMLGLLLLYKLLQPTSRVSFAANAQSISQASLIESVGFAVPESSTLERVGPFLVIAGIWILIVGGLVPMRLRHMYRKDSRMLAQFTVNVSRDGTLTENTAGTTSKCTWNVYDYWCEGKGIIVLMFQSGSYSILSLAGLSQLQQDELREILTASLKKK